MSYLDKLKQEAKQKQEQERASLHRQTQQEAVLNAVVRPALRRLHRYLYELIQHVKYVKSQIPVKYTLSGYGELESFHQSDYSISYLAEESKADFMVRCICTGPFKLRFEKHRQADAAEQKKYLHKHGLRFHFIEIPDSHYRFSKALFEVEPIIQADFIFEADSNKQCINLTVKNFLNLGTCFYTLKPEDITDSLLDELAKYLLREPNQLVLRERYHLPPAQRQKLEEVKKAHDYEEFNEWLDSMQSVLTEEMEKTERRNKLFKFFRRDK